MPSVLQSSGKGEEKRCWGVRKRTHLSLWSHAFKPGSHTPQGAGEHPKLPALGSLSFSGIPVIPSLDPYSCFCSPIQGLLIFCVSSSILSLRWIACYGFSGFEPLSSLAMNLPLCKDFFPIWMLLVLIPPDPVLVQDILAQSTKMMCQLPQNNFF